MKLKVRTESKQKPEEIYILSDGTTTDSEEEFNRDYNAVFLMSFVNQPELFDDDLTKAARDQIRAKLERGEQIPVTDMKSPACQEQYMLPSGAIVYSKEEFQKALAEYDLKEFAFDPQSTLFPDPKVEEVRARLRERFNSGETIDVVVCK